MGDNVSSYLVGLDIDNIMRKNILDLVLLCIICEVTQEN